jgi:pyruvate dehydrogenase E1 component alpha subunit/2-oxoisovalerate dehydrogenase E1 component alpha subunit
MSKTTEQNLKERFAPNVDGVYRILDIDGSVIGADPDLPEDTLKRMFRGMLQIRITDTRMLNMQRQGRIGFYGMATGQEAAVIGSAEPLEARDWLFPALREGGAAIYRGARLADMIAQNIGNAKDFVKGRQMPVHFSDRAVNHVSWSSVIATQLPQATGAAYAAKLRGDDIVTVGYLGDGASSEGDFHVALNFAAVYNTPTVFFCQNNQWAISVPFSDQTASDGVAAKAVAYGFDGIRVDGNDVLAVCEAMKAAVDKARSGGGPTLIEALTYRRHGHSSSDDPTKYRPEGQADAWAEKDPIDRFRSYLTDRGIWTQEWEDQITAEIKEELDDAVKDAEAAGDPDIRTMFEDVWGGELPAALQAQYDELMEDDKDRTEKRTDDGAFPL